MTSLRSLRVLFLSMLLRRVRREKSTRSPTLCSTPFSMSRSRFTFVVSLRAKSKLCRSVSGAHHKCEMPQNAVVAAVAACCGTWVFCGVAPRMEVYHRTFFATPTALKVLTAQISAVEKHLASQMGVMEKQMATMEKGIVQELKCIPNEPASFLGKHVSHFNLLI
ncbi:hypothetical protein B0H13DRAFT_1918493 [Mycena leptocephala]|nr:hypothetical protein B0H13DRAFT_1918493 [Mycena leptocephala]